MLATLGDVTTSIPNLRDVGGLPAAGGTVRPGRLLRSALPHLDDAVPEGIAWPPAVVVDLRSPGEHGNEHPLAELPTEHLNLPLLSALDPDKGWAADLPELYGRVVEEAPHLLVELVDTVAGTDGAVLVHCAAGKDRTGISVALVLRLLGVEHGPVLEDYLLTNLARDEIDRRLRRDDDYAVPAAFFEVRPDALQVALEAWDAHAEGVAGWYLAAGGSEERLAALRAGMIDQLSASADNASPLSR